MESSGSTELVSASVLSCVSPLAGVLSSDRARLDETAWLTVNTSVPESVVGGVLTEALSVEAVLGAGRCPMVVAELLMVSAVTKRPGVSGVEELKMVEGDMSEPKQKKKFTPTSNPSFQLPTESLGPAEMFQF